MKPQEAELVSEISKLQCMVSELRSGFTGALLELGHIQHGDVLVREELEGNRRSCHRRARHLEALVEALREELGVMQCQIVQLYSHRQKHQPDGKSSASKQRDGGEAAEASGQCPSSPLAPPTCAPPTCAPPTCAPPTCLSRGKLLLHCFLQGLKAGLSEGTDARHQVAMQLLHSEWEYVSTLNQLYDKYKTPPPGRAALEPYESYGKHVERLLQRHLLFRNTLQERLSAQHWKSVVGDILLQLIGQNDTSFSDMYLGYTTSLASFLSLEFNRLRQLQQDPDTQTQREEMKLLSLLLAPVSRIHSYLSHMQNLLLWTSKEHPDCSLLLGSERALRSLLSRCHLMLEEDVRWEEEEGGEGEREGGGQSSCEAAAASSSSAHRDSAAHRSEAPSAGAHREHPLSNGVGALPSLRVECWSCSPVRRKERASARPGPAAPDCGHARCCSLLTPDVGAGWGETSDSGQGTFSQPTVRSAAEPGERSADETDADDTSAFDFSSVTSCSPDGTLRRHDTLGSGEEEEEEGDEEEEEEEEEEDSQVPVLLKPSYRRQQQQQQQQQGRERTVCLRWQIPRMTPHPLLRDPEPQARGGEGPALAPCLVSSYGKRLVNVRKGSPPLHPKSAFRPIWDDPSKQLDSAIPEKENRQKGFVPVQAAAGRHTLPHTLQHTLQHNVHNSHPSRDTLRPGLLQPRAVNHTGATLSGGGLWEDSEDSEGPCSTV